MSEWTEEARRAAEAYRAAALADGWTSEPLSAHEPEESWSKLTRDGFVMHVVARRPHPPTERLMGRAKPEGAVSVWGPDRLGIKVGKVYSWDEIARGPRTCNECGATDVETFRFSFAGRAYAACIPEMRRVHERPGWSA